jgi:phosphatidylglycerophosphatase A
VLLIFSAACVAFGDRGEAKWGKDGSEIVSDETAGMCIPLLLLPAATVATPALTAFTLLFAFLAFRAFDIAKPWPANALQRIPGGWGVLLDDLVAGLYAAIVIIAISAFLL